jgi:hypothetical protein
MKEQFIHIDSSGNKFYYKDKAMTIFHREDGPAIEFADGTKLWFIDGKELSEEKFNATVNKSLERNSNSYIKDAIWYEKLRRFAEEIKIPIWVNGKKYQFDRDLKLTNHLIMKEQFIIVTKENSKFYYKDKEFTILHREDGPAVERFDGSKSFYYKDKAMTIFHREDGPAIEFADGTKLWFIDGKELSEEEFNARKNSCNGKVVTIEGKKYKLSEI